MVFRWNGIFYSKKSIGNRREIDIHEDHRQLSRP